MTLTDGVIRLEKLSETHLPGLASLLEDPDVLENTRVPEPAPKGFERDWLRAYEEGETDGTRDGFAIEDA